LISDGFEDIEAVAPIDILTRAGAEVCILSLGDGPVRGAYGTSLLPHRSLLKDEEPADGILLPGGRENAENLAAEERVLDLIRSHHRAGRIVAAICAAPALVLGEAAGILQGKQATGAPDFQDRLLKSGARVTGDLVSVDGNIVTALGPGAAIPFGLKLAEIFCGKEVCDNLADKWKIRGLLW